MFVTFSICTMLLRTPSDQLSACCSISDRLLSRRPRALKTCKARLYSRPCPPPLLRHIHDADLIYLVSFLGGIVKSLVGAVGMDSEMCLRSTSPCMSDVVALLGVRLQIIFLGREIVRHLAACGRARC
jgi:hypothetical protein